MNVFVSRVEKTEDARKNTAIVYGILPEKAQKNRFVYISLSLMFLIVSIKTSNILGVLLSILIIMAIFLEKKQFINERGISILYDMKFKSFIDEWSWNEITSLHWEESNNSQVIVHFGKGTMTRTYVINKHHIDNVVNNASSANPTIIIAPVE